MNPCQLLRQFDTIKRGGIAYETDLCRKLSPDRIENRLLPQTARTHTGRACRTDWINPSIYRTFGGTQYSKSPFSGLPV